MKRRARLIIGTANAMTCSPDEAVCVVVGTSCRALDTVEPKLIKKDLTNCQLG